MMTLSKIAKLANVSVSTASKAFSGSTEVSEETRQLVFRVAKEHGCFKKFYKAEYSKLVIAIIAPEFQSAYYTRYLSYIQNALKERNCELCVSSTNFSAEQEKDLVEYYEKYADVDGIIVIDSLLEKKEKCEVATVYVNYEKLDENIFSISKDARPAMKESVAYLLEKGVTDIGFIGELRTDGKERALWEILQQNGITPQADFFCISDGRFEEGGYQAMETLFARGRLPRAIICAYDYMAIGAIRCINDHGLSVPEDVAILGMDDIAGAAYLNPPLASISLRTQETCEMIVDMILGRINGDNEPKQKHIDSVFCLRRSFEID